MPTKRQALILAEIIRLFGQTDQPIGSKTLMESLPIQVSSATIRNEMATLEEEGFLEKTHLSSGRVPSIKGYRYYLDHLLTPATVPDNLFNTINQSFTGHFHEIDDLIDQSARILSQLTNYTAISLGPESEAVKLTGFRLVPLDNRNVIAILATNTGDVQSKVYRIPEGLSQDSLETAVRVINDELLGLPLVQVRHRLTTDIPMILTRYMMTPDGFLTLFRDALKQSVADHLHIGGKSKIFDFTEHQDVGELKQVYHLLDHEESLNRVLKLSASDDSMAHSISVRLGPELNNDYLNSYGLITARYHVTGYGQGVIALLGPTSMPYSQLIGVLQLMSDELVKKIIDYYHYLDDN